MHQQTDVLALHRYNMALDDMRQRIYTHGTKPLMSAFKIADNVRCVTKIQGQGGVAKEGIVCYLRAAY